LQTHKKADEVDEGKDECEKDDVYVRLTIFKAAMKD